MSARTVKLQAEDADDFLGNNSDYGGKYAEHSEERKTDGDAGPESAN